MRQVVLGLTMLVGVATANGQTAGMAETHAHKPSEVSTSLTVTVSGKSLSFSMADLKGMPQRTVTVRNGHSNTDEQYSGVLLSDLLGKLGVSLLQDGAKKVYHSYVRATGSDGYSVLYSASEVEGGMHAGDVLVATMQDGKALGADGQFKLVSSEDKRPARWVRNLKSIAMVEID